MGTFIGHVFPGLVFCGIGLWWLVQILLRYHKSKRDGSKFKSTPTYKCNCCCRKLKGYEWEGVFKTILCIIGTTGEIITGFHEGKFTYYGNAQHFTIFISFGISGVFDILRHHGLYVTDDMSYAMMTLCFAIEGVLFKFHLHGRDEIDVVIHTLLLYVVFCTVIACIVEAWNRHSFMAALTKAFLVILQGAWFICLGFILYNPFKERDWDAENHDHLLLATIYFSFHILAIVILILSLNCIIAVITGSKSKQSYKHLPFDAAEERKLLDGNENGFAVSLEESYDLQADLNTDNNCQ